MVNLQGRGYSLFSILIHWLGAAALIYMFVTGEAMDEAKIWWTLGALQNH